MEAMKTETKKLRVRLVNEHHVDETVFVEAASFEEAEAKAGEAESYLVEPMIACAGCGREMGQTDPRTSRYSDGSPVHSDPWNAYEGIRCIACGPAKT
jgi:hypothetical protein